MKGGKRSGKKILDFFKIAKVVESHEKYGPDISQLITLKNTYSSTDWIAGDFLSIILNGEAGKGVDIFFALKLANITGYILVLDQRKRMSSSITDSSLSNYISALPGTPNFLTGATETVFGTIETVFGLMNIYSTVDISNIPDGVFYLSQDDSLRYHGTFFEHPGCSRKIDVNTATKTALCQLFTGSNAKRQKLADDTIKLRCKVKIDNLDQIVSLIKDKNLSLNESMSDRITY